MLSPKNQREIRTKKLIVATALATMMFAALAGPPAHATSFSIDNSDLWWNPNESGWGLQLVQRSEVIFATLFVYNDASVPVWYSATLEPNGFSSWTGALAQCNGPWFGSVPFDPRLKTCTQVGNMNFTAFGDQDGMLVYSVNGVTVNKMITRETLRMQDSSGNYAGILSLDAVGCANPADGGRSQNRIDFSLVQNGNTLTMMSQEQGSSAACTYSGSYTQVGQFGYGTQVLSSCSDGSKAPGDALILEEVLVSNTGVTMNFTAPSSNSTQKGCTLTGSIYGIRQ